MGTFRVARRYAKGLFEYAFEAHGGDVVYADMKNLAVLVSESRELQLFLQNPLLNPKKKSKIAKEAFKSFSEISRRFIELLIFHRREVLLGLTALEYQKMYQTAQGVAEVLVTTAIPLDKVLQERIIDKISRILGPDQKYALINKVNPAIIGGFLLRVGDKQWDSSIRGQFARLRTEFLDYDYVKRY